MLLKALGKGFGKASATDVFILGSGFSRAVAPTMPTLPELSKRVFQTLPRLEVNRLPPMAQSNLEIALAYYLTKQPWLSESEYHRRFADGLDLLAQIAPALEAAELETVNSCKNKAPQWLSSLVHWMHDQQAAIVTFNYDTLLEKTFADIHICEISNKFNPIELDPRALYPVRFAPGSSQTGFKECWPTAEVLKLHGSINWSYSGAKEFFGESIQYTAPSRWSESCGNAGPDDKVPLIAPPVADKLDHLAHESLHHLWQIARRHLRQAQRVYCIGLGFPDTDLPIRFLLSDSTSVSPVDFYLIDLNEDIIGRVKSILPSRYTLRLDHFGSEWNAKLLNYLWGLEQVEQGGTANPPLCNKLRSFMGDRYSTGQQVQLIRDARRLEIKKISERGLIVHEEGIPGPFDITFCSLARIIEHLERNPSPLPIARPSELYNAMSVEYLMSPWYTRACGRAIASLLLHCGIVALDSLGNIGGITKQFAAS